MLVNLHFQKRSMARSKKYGFSFSWKRAIGLTGVKQQIAKSTGIPMSKQGLERKVGASLLDAALSVFGVKKK
jgi:hypothetical protein